MAKEKQAQNQTETVLWEAPWYASENKKEQDAIAEITEWCNKKDCITRLLKDGTVQSDFPAINKWRDISSISSTRTHIFGLTKKGSIKVETIDPDMDMTKDKAEWSEIIQQVPLWSGIKHLRMRGAMGIGFNTQPCAVGVCFDGTVKYAGTRKYGGDAARNLKKIESIAVLTAKGILFNQQNGTCAGTGCFEKYSGRKILSAVCLGPSILNKVAVLFDNHAAFYMDTENKIVEFENIKRACIFQNNYLMLTNSNKILQEKSGFRQPVDSVKWRSPVDVMVANHGTPHGGNDDCAAVLYKNGIVRLFSSLDSGFSWQMKQIAENICAFSYAHGKLTGLTQAGTTDKAAQPEATGTDEDLSGCACVEFGQQGDLAAFLERMKSGAGSYIPPIKDETKKIKNFYVYKEIYAYQYEDGSIKAFQTDQGRETFTENYSGFQDVIAIAASDRHIAGLTSAGKVIAAGDNYDQQCNTFEWINIIQVHCLAGATVGLCADGTVKYAGELYGEDMQSISSWTGIKQIAAYSELYDSNFVVGLKEDGTIIAAGDRPMNIFSNSPAFDFNPKKWRDIKRIWTIDTVVAAQKTDGKLIWTGIDHGETPNPEAEDILVCRDVVKAVPHGNLFVLFRNGEMMIQGRALETGSGGSAELFLKDKIVDFAVLEDQGTILLSEKGKLLYLDDSSHKQEVEKWSAALSGIKDVRKLFTVRRDELFIVHNETLTMLYDSSTDSEFCHIIQYDKHNVRDATLTSDGKSVIIEYTDNSYDIVGDYTLPGDLSAGVAMFRKIPDDSGFVGITADGHAFIITEKTGLGFYKYIANYFFLKDLEGVTDIQTWKYGLAVLCNNGKVYAVGWRDYSNYFDYYSKCLSPVAKHWVDIDAICTGYHEDDSSKHQDNIMTGIAGHSSRNRIVFVNEEASRSDECEEVRKAVSFGKFFLVLRTKGTTKRFLGKKEDVPYPELPLSKGIKDICKTPTHLALLAEDGDFWYFEFGGKQWVKLPEKIKMMKVEGDILKAYQPAAGTAAAPAGEGKPPAQAAKAPSPKKECAAQPARTVVEGEWVDTLLTCAGDVTISECEILKPVSRIIKTPGADIRIEYKPLAGVKKLENYMKASPSSSFYLTEDYRIYRSEGVCGIYDRENSLEADVAKPAGLKAGKSKQLYREFLTMCLLYTTQEYLEELVLTAAKKKDGKLALNRVQNIAYSEVTDGSGNCFRLVAKSLTEDVLELKIIKEKCPLGIIKPYAGVALEPHKSSRKLLTLTGKKWAK